MCCRQEDPSGKFGSNGCAWTARKRSERSGKFGAHQDGAMGRAALAEAESDDEDGGEP